MTARIDIEAVVFDVLGTMVDEPGGLRAAIRQAVPGSEGADLDDLVNLWLEHVDREQRRIGAGGRSFARSDVIDWEAAARVAERAGVTDPVSIDRLATASQRLEPWPDSVAGLTRIADRMPVLGLSNASRATLFRLNAHAGLRWHQVLSAEDASAYKPAQETYELAVEASGSRPDHVLMVAAHAWDLRGAQAAGMRTAYLPRPAGDPPTQDDTFDWRFESLAELVAELSH
jgi:2-haloacid dehalogenase